MEGRGRCVLLQGIAHHWPEDTEEAHENKSEWRCSSHDSKAVSLQYTTKSTIQATEYLYQVQPLFNNLFVCYITTIFQLRGLFSVGQCERPIMIDGMLKSMVGEPCFSKYYTTILSARTTKSLQSTICVNFEEGDPLKTSRYSNVNMISAILYCAQR
jgi:hypothetical protein